MGLAVGVHGLPASAVVIVRIGTHEADQGACVFLLTACVFFLAPVVFSDPDRRVDEVVVVVGDTEEESETIPRSGTRKKGFNNK